MIAIRDLHKRFGALKVLDGVSLDIHDGKTLVILGRSGMGKSVLLKHIIGLMRPDSGSVRVDDIEVTTLSYSELAGLRRRFGMLFQLSALFDSMTVGKNVGLALREHTKKSEEEIRAIISEKLRLVGLEGIEEKKPAELSGGMRKRVGLARAIAMDPAYILYDEPTTGLDPITAQQINILIRDLQKALRITSIVVTHDMKSAYFVGDRLCLLHDGRIIFDGTPDEIERSDDQSVQQFIRGGAVGPMTEERQPGDRKRSRWLGRP